MPLPAHVSHTATIHLRGGVARVFPLFEPEGERHWAPGWSPRYLWPADGAARTGTTFLTEDGSVVWMLIEHEPGRRVVYSNLRQGAVAGRIEVRTAAAPDGGTSAEVRYDLTALSPAAEHPLMALGDDGFRAWIGEWEMRINAHLEASR